MIRVNVGCGRKPISGWRNFDNSPSVLLSKCMPLANILNVLGLVGPTQMAFIRECRPGMVEYGNPVSGLHINDSSVGVFYACHVFEHLDRDQALGFLREAKRILSSGGIIRIVVPNLRRLATIYMETGDAERFMHSLMMSPSVPKTLIGRLIWAITGPRNHLWMYDGNSLRSLLAAQGFLNATEMEPGATGICDPAGLDLREREEESICVEASK